MTEACRIVIQEISPGVYDVGAPMKHKELCYDILRDAGSVIERLHEMHFTPAQKVLTVVMDMSGTVDVSAPIPPKAKCEAMLKSARLTIEMFDDAQAPVMRAFSDKLVGKEHADSLSSTS